MHLQRYAQFGTAQSGSARFGLAILGCLAAFIAPAQAADLAPGASGLIFTQFSTIAATQGTRVALADVVGSGPGFDARLVTAVYRNTLGTLDFYYQSYQTGPGASGNQEITFATPRNFGGFQVDAFISPTDLDGDGPFTVVNNRLPVDMATTRVGRSASGDAILVDLHAVGVNGLLEGENTATWIFRTDARVFTTGSLTLSGGGSDAVLAAFAPGVPEPASWGMLIAGFGLVGGVTRRRRMLRAAVC